MIDRADDISRIMYEQNVGYETAKYVHETRSKMDELKRKRKNMLRTDLANKKHTINLMNLYGCSAAMANRIFNAGRPTK